MLCDTQMKHYVFVRPDIKCNESQLKDSYYLLDLVSGDRIPIELVLSSFFLLKPNQFLSEVSGNLANMASDFYLQPPKGDVISKRAFLFLLLFLF